MNNNKVESYQCTSCFASLEKRGDVKCEYCGTFNYVPVKEMSPGEYINLSPTRANGSTATVYIATGYEGLR